VSRAVAEADAAAWPASYRPERGGPFTITHPGATASRSSTSLQGRYLAYAVTVTLEMFAW
jgi:hypothetical protein